MKQLGIAWFGLNRRPSNRPAGVFLTRDLGGSATQDHPPQHHAKFTSFSRDLGGSVEGNSVGASFCLRCSYGNFGSKRVFWYKTRSCRTAGAGRSVSLQAPAVALRKIYKLKSRFRRPSRKEFVRCIFLSTVFLGQFWLKARVFGTKHAPAGRPVRATAFCRSHPLQHCVSFTSFSRGLGGPIERSLSGGSSCPRCS